MLLAGDLFKQSFGSDGGSGLAFCLFRRTHRPHQQLYSHDSLYRLTGETLTDAINGDYHASYQYDRVGNRSYSIVEGVHIAYSYDANDRLTQQGGTHYSQDPNYLFTGEQCDANLNQY